MNISILLTATVNIQNKTYIVQRHPQERLNSYLKAITQWLKNTSFNITLVENSGYTFPELQQLLDEYNHRFEIISFIESEIPEAHFIKHCDSKGSSEMFSIDYAYYQSKFLRNSDFIIKVTSRFFIPNFESYLKSENLENYDCICQNDRMRCEMVGCKTIFFHKLFNIYMINEENRLLPWSEAIFKFRINTFFKKPLICKKLPIEKTQRGGCVIPYTYI